MRCGQNGRARIRLSPTLRGAGASFASARSSRPPLRWIAEPAVRQKVRSRAFENVVRAKARTDAPHIGRPGLRPDQIGWRAEGRLAAVGWLDLGSASPVADGEEKVRARRYGAREAGAVVEHDAAAAAGIAEQV